jgi:hypothetical protein
VRIWKLKVKLNDCASGTSGISLNDALRSEFHEVLVLYGHTARVWDVLFLKDGSLVSIGEVKTCFVVTLLKRIINYFIKGEIE